MKLLRRKTLDSATRDAYWMVVRDCLILLFSAPDAAASRLCLDRSVAVDLAPPRVRSTIFYHREPFDVASDLAVNLPNASSPPSLNDPQTLASYESILAQHGLL